MNKITTYVEQFIWNNWKMYLLQHSTCLCDNILPIKDIDAEKPYDRYEDFANQLEQHIGLGSYVVQQATQFSNLPYITVNVQQVEVDNCSARIALVFNVVFATDTPSNEQTTREPGNSSEGVAAFRADIISSLDEMMYSAFGENAEGYGSRAFFDSLRDSIVTNPVNPTQTKDWQYNLVGTVDGDKIVTSVHQLKREDRSSGLSVFDVVYYVDINRLYGDGVDCGC